MAQIVDGQQFGRFQIVSRLGRGGMASVYRAYEHALDRTVALKVLPEELLDQPGFVERFEREARAIAKLEHPHIVPLYARGIDEGQPWMALRLVRGGHLGERMEGGALERDVGLDYLAKIADALEFAHSQGIVHRDLKPQNILVGARGECYVADFGIASMLEGATKLTQTGAALGTPQYMAPEQAKGETVGPAADIYALGIVVYQWQTGLLPFDADTPYAVMFKHVTAPLPMQPLEHLPERSRQVIARALAKVPSDRWPTASVFVRELRASLVEPAIARAPPSVSPRARAPDSDIPAGSLPEAPVAAKSNDTSARAAAPSSAGIPGTEVATGAAKPTTSAAPSSKPRRSTTSHSDIEAASGPEAPFAGKSSGRSARATPPGSTAIRDTPTHTGDARLKRGKLLGAIATIALLSGGGWGVVEWRHHQDVAAWTVASEADTEAAYGAYQRAYPSGRYVAQATSRIAEVRRKELQRLASVALAAQEKRKAEAAERVVAEQLAEDRRKKEETLRAEEARATEQKRKAQDALARNGGFVDNGNGTLRDTQTGLIWTQSDNGREVDGNGAIAYCQGKGMRLPTREELTAIYKRPRAGTTPCGTHATCRTSPLFRLENYWFWSGTKVSSSELWILNLAHGQSGGLELQFIPSDGNTKFVMFSRALCVGRS